MQPEPHLIRQGAGFDTRIIFANTYVLALNEESPPEFIKKNKRGSWVLWNECKLWIPQNMYMYLRLP